MLLSEHEILRDYRQARNKVAQIQILADMNMCSKYEITKYLEQRGVRVLKCGTVAERRETIRYLYDQGLCDEEIAVQTGMKASSVGTIRAKLGLKKHKKRKPATTDFLKSSV